MGCARGGLREAPEHGSRDDGVKYEANHAYNKYEILRLIIGLLGLNYEMPYA